MQKLKELLGLALILIVTYTLFINIWGVVEIATWFALPIMLAETFAWKSIGNKQC